MELIINLGRLGEATECRGKDYRWERFGRYTVAPFMQVLDRHHGEPVAALVSHRTEGSGMVSGVFEVHEGCGLRVRALAARSRAMSIEFEGGRREFVEPSGSWGPMVMTHYGAMITGVAFEADPSRSDARLLSIKDAEADTQLEVESRGLGSERALIAGLPEAVRRRYFTPAGDGLVRHGPHGRLESFRRY